jgi:hypothetical protein
MTDTEVVEEFVIEPSSDDEPEIPPPPDGRTKPRTQKQLIAVHTNLVKANLKNEKTKKQAVKYKELKKKIQAKPKPKPKKKKHKTPPSSSSDSSSESEEEVVKKKKKKKNKKYVSSDSDSDTLPPPPKLERQCGYSQSNNYDPYLNCF